MTAPCHRTNKMKTNIKSGIFHCPHEMCLYTKGSARYFKSRTLLNQHITKVHAEKKFLCEKCKKGFGSEWQQRHHERTCGIQWQCSCGHKYNCRETLLTHHRRTQHPLPQDVVKPRRGHSATRNNVEINNQVTKSLFLLMPVSQATNSASLQSQLIMPGNASQDKKHICKILPKLPIAGFSPLNMPNSSMVFQQENNQISRLITVNTGELKTYTSVNTQTVSTQTVETQTELDNVLVAATKLEPSLKRRKTVAATQTGRLSLESRASQCSSRTPTSIKNRRRSYRGTSIETQTVESIVGKIKSTLHSKSRVSTKPMKSDREAQSVWSCLNKLLTSTLSRSSSGTQTSPRGKINRMTCASQTLTEDRRGPSSEQTAHEMLGLLATVCQHLKDNSGTKESALSSLQTMMTSSLGEYFISRKDKPETLSNTEPINSVVPCLVQSESFCQFNLEEPDTISVLGDINVEPTVPILSTNETQTCTMTCPDLFSTNMETQTTDDTFLSELELSHIQTQTPWDFLDFCDDLNTNQLSADIQTDITGEEFKDIFEDTLWNTNASTSLADVTDMETQTYGFLPNMELISSYTQTLDDSLKIDLPIPILK